MEENHYYVQPSPESLARRLELSKLLPPLKRVRARVPFFYLAAHRIPTLWTLYRGLLREAPTKNVRMCSTFANPRLCTTTNVSSLDQRSGLRTFQRKSTPDKPQDH
jgi:hypothetical protein